MRVPTLLLALLASPALAEATVVTGETLRLDGETWRLKGVHCPEPDEPGGETAALALQELLTRGEVACDLVETDGEGVRSGWCRAGDVELNDALVGGGVCGRCAPEDPEKRLADAQRAGGWSGQVPTRCRQNWWEIFKFW